MEITADQIYQKIQERASRDPFVAEIVRNCALEAALEVAQQRLEVDDVPEEG